MRNINTVRTQNIFDAALELAGNIDAIPELLVQNDFVGKITTALNVASDEIDLGLSLKPGQKIVFDEANSLFYERKIIQDMTYKTGPQAGRQMRIVTGIKTGSHVFSKTFAKTFK